MQRRSRRRVARIKYTTDEARAAADAIVPVAKGVVEQLIERCIEIAREGKEAAARRPRGRGAQLKAADQLLIMFWAQTVSNRPGEIAKALGMHRRTVARVLASKKYHKVDQYVSERVTMQALNEFGGVRGFLRSLR